MVDHTAGNPHRSTSPDELPDDGRRGMALLEEAARNAAPAEVDLPPGSLLNMDLSQLAFNERVLELALDSRIPLLERVRFISIFGGNLDEFFMTRVAGFKRQVALGTHKQTIDGLTPSEQLELIDQRTRALLRAVYDDILPELSRKLRDSGIEILGWSDLSDADRAYLRSHYSSALDTVIYPVHVRPGAPFPHVRNLRPAFLVRYAADSPPGEASFAIVEIPGDLPRLLPLPGGRRFVSLADVVRSNLPRLIGVKSEFEAHLFRVTRSGNLSFDPDSADDLVEAIAENVALRPFQPVVRLEIEAPVPQWCRDYLVENLREEAESRFSYFHARAVYEITGAIDLERMHLLADLPIDALRYPRARRRSPLRPGQSVFEQIRDDDILLSFPRHSFERTVERFFHEASHDPFVDEIWITLYRTSVNSRLVRLLLGAQRRGKKVTALIELKATFDEQRNLEWARMLEVAGIRVLYGSPRLKVHAKIACVVRRDTDAQRVYAYVGTGNLNAATAATYTDLGLLTGDPAIATEVLDLFRTMAGDDRVCDYDSLVVAPFNMRRFFVNLVEREIRNAMQGKTSGIFAKLNGIADREVVAALYRANAAGVDIDLVIRGICAVRPGVPGLSERIRVVSVVGRFLEHSRIFRFENAGSPEYYIGSADWRGRNLSRRVEAMTPILNSEHRARLDRILRRDFDNPGAWDLGPDGRYVRRGVVSSGSPLPGGSALAGID